MACLHEGIREVQRQHHLVWLEEMLIYFCDPLVRPGGGPGLDP